MKKKTKKKTSEKITLLQKRLVEIYISMLKPNQAKAYELAGYKCRGKTAEQEASKTLKKPQVKKYLQKLQKRTEERAVKDASDIIAELEKIGFSNIGDFVEFSKNKVTIKDFSKLSEEKLAAIAEISGTDVNIVKLKLYDKARALKDLGLRFGIFPTKIEHTGEITLAQAVHKAMKDAK